MSDWKQTIADAKELLDMGAITKEQFEQIRDEALIKRTESDPSTVSVPPDVSDMGTQIQGNVSTETTSGMRDLGTMVVGSNSTPTSSVDHLGTVIGADVVNTIGSYRILHLLGEGGMGSVYRGRHKNDQVAKARGDVAIKMIHPNLAKDEGFRTRFVKEGLFGMSLQHPNIAKVTEVIDEQGLLAVVMEYIDGQELKEMIPKDGMPVEEVVRLLKPIASALDHLHEKGIVHRDMKPTNVRVKPDGTPVILDFGIAKDTNEADSGMTQTGTAMGTQTYMAPEQMDAKRVTGKADQYALTMMAYQMLSGELPWEESLSSARVTMTKITGALENIDVKMSCSTSINEVIMKGLSLDSEQRFETCLTFIEGLEENKETSDSPPNKTVDIVQSKVVSSTSKSQAVASSNVVLQKEKDSGHQQDVLEPNRDASSEPNTTRQSASNQNLSEESSSSQTTQEHTANSMPKILVGAFVGCLLIVGLFQSSGDEQVVQTKETVKVEVEETKFTTADAELVARQWNDSLNNHDVAAYANLISDVVWYYRTPLLKNSAIQRKASAFRKDPNFTQSIMNVQTTERKNGLFHVSFLKDSTYKGKRLTNEAFLWVKNVNGKLQIVREADSSSLRISTTKRDPSMQVSIGNYDGSGSQDMLVSYPSSENSDGTFTNYWWLFTDDDVVNGATYSYDADRHNVYVDTSLSVPGLIAPFFVLQPPLNGTCYYIDVYGFVSQDQHHTTREKLYSGDMCGIEEHGHFYTKNDALYFRAPDEDIKLFPNY